MNEITNGAFNVNLGIKEEKKLQEESDVASQSSVSRAEAKKVGLFRLILSVCPWQEKVR